MDDSISMNSFNSSLNFAKLQSQINRKQNSMRHNQSNLSESTTYFKSRLSKMSNYGSHNHFKVQNRRDEESSATILADVNHHGAHAGGDKNAYANAVNEEVIMEEQEDNSEAGTNNLSYTVLDDP